jgi:glycosyltransferase involved in cell wall biosynthesis
MNTNLDIIYSCFLTNSGYTRASLGYIRSLGLLGNNIYINCVHKYPQGNSFTKDELFIINKTCSMVKMEGDVLIEHVIPNRWRNLLNGSRRYCVAVFENEKVDDFWIESINRVMHGVIYPCSWNKKIFENCGVNKPGFVVPHFLDEFVWKKQIVTDSFLNKFSFCVIATWRERKNWSTLFKSFELLKNKHDFVLGIKTDKHFELINYVKENHPNIFSNIILETNELDDYGMVKMMSKFDVIVNFSLGEAFCMPLLQGLFLGKPFVSTDIEGVKDFASPEYGVFIPSNGDLRKDRLDSYGQFRNKIWPYFDPESSCRALLEIIEKYNYYKSNIDKDQDRFLKKFGLNNSISNNYWDPVLNT